MAKFFVEGTKVHQHFKEVFKTMEEKGIKVEAFGGMVHFFLDSDTFPDLRYRDHRHVQIVDAETQKEITDFPPRFGWRIKIWNS